MANSKWFATDKENVSDTIAAIATLAGFGLSVYPERCVRVRNRHSSCDRCAQACTSGAISLQDETWVMDPEKCVGCGTCATVCPTCALETKHPNDVDVLRGAKASAQACGGKAVFACHRAMERFVDDIDPDKVVQVICLSRIEETLVATLLAQGAAQVVGICADCESCPRSQGIQSAHMVQETFAEIARVWNIDGGVTIVDKPPVYCMGKQGTLEKPAIDLSKYLATTQDPQLSSGSTITTADNGAIQATYKPVHVMADGTLPHFVPTRRRKLLDQLQAFGEPNDTQLDTRLWGHVIIDFSVCQSCKMCAVFCPTGAICKYTDSDVAIGIEHYVAECVHCCLCQDICPAGAISCVTQVPALQLAHCETERYHMPDPAWYTGPDQILRKLRPQIDSLAVDHSY